MHKIPVVLLLALSGMAGDVTGTWTGTFNVSGSDRKEPQYFILKQDGKKLTGTGGPDAVEQYPILNGTVDGYVLTFEVTTGRWQFKYELRAVGRGMMGTLHLKSKEGSVRIAQVMLTKVRLQQGPGCLTANQRTQLEPSWTFSTSFQSLPLAKGTRCERRAISMRRW